jgi:hypothetical protein
MAHADADSFFAGIDQVDVWSAGQKVKLPIFYRDARAFFATFPANFFELKKLLPDPRFSPAQIFPGVGAINIACFEYFDTDVGPYNEVAFNVVLNNPHILPVPGYNLIRQIIQFNFYPYIFHLPVTTEAALRWGIDFSGFPKFLAAIDFKDTEDTASCELKDDGDFVCKLRVRKLATPMSRIVKLLISLYQQGQPQKTEFRINARQLGISIDPRDVELQLGMKHPIARELSRALLTTKAITSAYIPSSQIILFGPGNLSLPLINSLFQKGMRIPLDSLKRE